MASQSQLPPRDLPEVPYFTLDMRERPEADAVELLLTGDLDTLTVGHLEDSLDWAVSRLSHRHVVVDVSGLQRLDPCAVEPLLRVRQALEADHRTLTLRGEPAVGVELLRGSGLPDLAPRTDA